MKELKGKVAVITGGASGIGRAIAERFAEEGMKIVLADVEREALDKAEGEMKNDGAEVLAVRTDVSDAEDMSTLAAKTLDAYGAVHVLCNNAGVGTNGLAWEISLSDWRWTLGVNLWGVIHGVRTFVPIMLEGGQEGHIVNVASMAGLMTSAGMAPYFVSKHGVVALSEALCMELQQMQSNIKVSVLCPGFVSTNIADADRNRPGGSINPDALDPMGQMLREYFRKSIQEGLSPKQVAEAVLQAILDEKFYILTHPELKGAIQARMETILNERTPELTMPPDQETVEKS